MRGLPLLKPPYGRITAIDLNKGDIVWQIAHGETPDNVRNNPALKGLNIPRTGHSGLLGPLVTKTFCRKTFTILPICSPPYGHYSLHCRQQAWVSLRKARRWEESVPHTKEPDRLPDPSTVRRWAGQLFCLGLLLACRLWQATGWNISAHPPSLPGTGPQSALFCPWR